MGTFLSLRLAVIEKWELADARRPDREGDKRIYYEQVPLFVDAYVRV